MLRFKLLFVVIFAIVGFASAKGLYCLSFYDHLLKNQTAVSGATFASIKSAISALKKTNENQAFLEKLATLIKTLPSAEAESVFDFLMDDYKSLAKESVLKKYPYAPKRSIDFLMARIHNPLPSFETTTPLNAYKKYLESFQNKGTNFLPVKMIFEILVNLNRDLIDSSAYGDSKYLLFGSFINGRSSEVSDIDIIEYLDTKSKSRYSSTYAYLKLRKLSDFEVSGTYGKYAHYDMDTIFALDKQPLAILMSTTQMTFIIKNEETLDQPKSFVVSIEDLKKFTESL